MISFICTCLFIEDWKKDLKNEKTIKIDKYIKKSPADKINGKFDFSRCQNIYIFFNMSFIMILKKFFPLAKDSLSSSIWMSFFFSFLNILLNFYLHKSFIQDLIFLYFFFVWNFFFLMYSILGNYEIPVLSHCRLS